MLRFAIKNILTRRLRSMLAVVGLSVAIVGVIGLISFSTGIRASVSETLSMVEGLSVVKKWARYPTVSRIPIEYGAEIEAIPGVKVAVPEVWQPLFTFDESGDISRILQDSKMVVGADLRKYQFLTGGGLFRRKLTKGRFPDISERGFAIISESTAERFNLDVGSRLKIFGRELDVIGLYKTGAQLLDEVILVSIEDIREMTSHPDNLVSCFYVEAHDPSKIENVAAEIHKRLPTVEAKTTSAWLTEFKQLMFNIDVFLVVVSSIAIVVGAIGIINTMLMSVTERFSEIGILKANGWTQGDVVKLILLESLCLGFIGGVLGCILGVLGVHIVAQFLPVEPVVEAWLLAMSLALSMGLGVVGGAYPAYVAARMNPIDAIRFG